MRQLRPYPFYNSPCAPPSSETLTSVSQRVCGASAPPSRASCRGLAASGVRGRSACARVVLPGRAVGAPAAGVVRGLGASPPASGGGGRVTPSCLHTPPCGPSWALSVAPSRPPTLKCPLGRGPCLPRLSCRCLISRPIVSVVLARV